MAIAVATTRQNLCDRYTSLGNWLGVTTAAPGAGPAVGSEASGGTPAYARKQTTWTPATGGVSNGSATTIDLPAGTFTHAVLCSAVTGSTMLDWSAWTSVVLPVPGQLVLTPTFTVA